MIDLIYSIEDFKRIIEEKNIPKESIRLGYISKVKDVFGVITAVLTAPSTHPITGEPIVLMCEVSEIIYDPHRYEFELRQNTVGEERKRIKDWVRDVEKFVEEKLGFLPIRGRWIEKGTGMM